MGLATVSGLTPAGFFIPYRHAGALGPTGYPALLPRFEASTPRFREVLGWIGEAAPALQSFEGPAPEPRWDQDWFPRLDGAAAYGIVRRLKPARIVEVGSGHSTRFMARAARDAGGAIEIVCIDPAPRASLAGLEVRHLPQLLSAVSAELFASLAADDILFIDSSHIAMPGTDVDRLLGDVLPRLAPGVLVHFHDIFLPDGYPEPWRWRGYNEQLAVACLLLGEAFEPLFASHHVASCHPEWLAEAGVDRLPLLPGAFESSLWLRKRPT